MALSVLNKDLPELMLDCAAEEELIYIYLSIPTLSVCVFGRRVERGVVPSPHHAHRVRRHDERHGQKVHGLPADAGQRPHDRHGPVAAVPPRRRLLPDGQQHTLT